MLGSTPRNLTPVLRGLMILVRTKHFSRGRLQEHSYKGLSLGTPPLQRLTGIYRRPQPGQEGNLRAWDWGWPLWMGRYS